MCVCVQCWQNYMYLYCQVCLKLFFAYAQYVCVCEFVCVLNWWHVSRKEEGQWGGEETAGVSTRTTSTHTHTHTHTHTQNTKRKAQQISAHEHRNVEMQKSTFTQMLHFDFCTHFNKHFNSQMSLHTFMWPPCYSGMAVHIYINVPHVQHLSKNTVFSHILHTLTQTWTQQLLQRRDTKVFFLVCEMWVAC